MNIPSLRKFVFVVIPVVLVLSIAIVQSGTATVVNFDSLDTSGGYVSGLALDEYLAGFGITHTESAGALLMVEPAPFWAPTSSNPNELSIASDYTSGTSWVSYTLQFAQPVNALSFTITGITPGSSMGSWSATSYSASDAILGSVSGGPYGYVPVQTWNLAGSDIDHVTFFSDAYYIYGTFLKIDDLTFTSAPVPEPGTMMLLGSGLVGLAGYGRKRIRK